jgi:AcrR family transcriptional regulator
VSDPSPRARQRRSSAEVRSLLIDAARDLFRAEGYDATTTKEIARRAGVSEPLLFTHFGSKQQLFEAAILAPFADLVDEYMAGWRADAAELTIDALLHDFLVRLFDLARANRTLLLSLSLRRAGAGSAGDGDLLDQLADKLQGLRELMPEMEHAHLHHLDAPATTAAVAGMVFGVALLDDLLFPHGMAKPSRGELMAELTTLTLHGLAHREPPAS